MTVSPVSADLLIKLGLGVAVLAALYYVSKGTVSAIADALPPLDAINPASDQNLIYRGTNAIGQAAGGGNGWTLGGWIYDATHPTYTP